MENSNMTMEMIARECGVSRMTVSRVMNPRFSGKILPETRERILKVVKKYNYQSNISASRLKRKKLDTITLLMGLRATRGPQATPDFDLHYEMISWGIVKGVVQEARKHNYDVKIEPLFSNENYLTIIDSILPNFTDGVILCMMPNSIRDIILNHLADNNLPNTIINASGINNINRNTALIDRKSGLLEAIEHLYKKGHRKIAFIGSDLQQSSIEQKQVYSEYLIEKNIYNEEYFYSVDNFLQLKTLLTGFKNKFPFTGLLCHNDSLADLTIKELSFAGLRTPEDIAIIGFDGNPVYQGEGRTNPSSVYMPYIEASSTAARMLIKNILTTSSEKYTNEIVKTYFMQGATT